MKITNYQGTPRFFGFPKNREVAQLVAHYVRDVGVGRSSRLFSTETTAMWLSFLVQRDFHARVLISLRSNDYCRWQFTSRLVLSRMARTIITRQKRQPCGCRFWFRGTFTPAFLSHFVRTIIADGNLRVASSRPNERIII